jgi:hypothetical protein
MPAVELSRLHEQLARLVVLFDRPVEFTRALRDLCEIYADYSFRSPPMPGAALLPAYRLPALVQRQVEIELGAVARLHPAHALAISDALWVEDHFEPRLLGAILLGQIPLNQAEGILERLRTWAVPTTERRMVELLLEHGTKRLRAEGPDALLELFGEWITRAETSHRIIGLKALTILVGDPDFENLPAVFNLIFLLVQSTPSGIFNELSALLIDLARRSPNETTYLLRQVTSGPSGKDAPRLARRILPYLSAIQQESLRTALKYKR